MSPILYWFLLLPAIVVGQRGAGLEATGLAVLAAVWLAGHFVLYSSSSLSAETAASSLSYEKWRAAVFSSSSEMGWGGILFLVALLAIFLTITFWIVPSLGLDTDETGQLVGAIPGCIGAAIAARLLGPLFHRLGSR